MKHYVPFCGPGDYLGDLFSPWMTGVQKDSQPVQAHEGLCSHQSLTSDWPKKSYDQVHTMGRRCGQPPGAWGISWRHPQQVGPHVGELALGQESQPRNPGLGYPSLLSSSCLAGWGLHLLVPCPAHLLGAGWCACWLLSPCHSIFGMAGQVPTLQSATTGGGGSPGLAFGGESFV